jgi:CRP-like cAMP-binding protein
MSVKHFIQNNIDSSYNPEDDLPFPILIKNIRKHVIVTPYERIEHHAYFLLSGIVKISMMRHEEEERILEFFFPNSFFSCYTSFITQKPSNVQIETLTDCEVEVIKYADMQEAYKTSLLANKLGRIVAEHYYIHKTNREKDFLTKTATERYQNLVNQRPELVQQIPVHQIARYLGIEPESLSRIRKSIT